MYSSRFSSRVCRIRLGPQAVWVIVSVLVGLGIGSGALGKAAERRGAPRLGLRSLEWDDEGWPRAGPRLEIPR